MRNKKAECMFSLATIALGLMPFAALVQSEQVPIMAGGGSWAKQPVWSLTTGWVRTLISVYQFVRRPASHLTFFP